MEVEFSLPLARQAWQAAQAGVHPVDLCVAWISARSKLFRGGWGDEVFLARIPEFRAYLNSLPAIDIDWLATVVRRSGIHVRDGRFPSPVGSLPAEAATAYVRAWERKGNRTACVLLAASRDEGYGVRERVFGSLAERGLNLYILENAFYGLRRTPAGPSLATVSDHILMVLATLCEARVLLKYLGDRYTKLVVAGYSMGGHMAALAAAGSPMPVACAALATGASGSAVYTRGLLQWSVDFPGLAGDPNNVGDARNRLEQLFLTADITQHPKPLRSDAAIVAGCTRDAYVLRTETERLHRHWAGSTLRWIDAGHFSALATSRRSLCDCVIEAAAKL